MILVIDMSGKRDSLGYYEFVLPILEVAKELDKYTVKHYSETTSRDLAECNKIILSGTALKDNITLNEPEKFSWLKSVDKPILGICAGMQTIGVVFGLLLTRCLEVGMTSITTLSENPMFSAAFKAYSLHNYSVESSEDFEVLAESPRCLQAIKHKQKPIYGVLFHPEVRNTEILKRFITLKQ
jgi:GMP synthase-like glutamine amidotransferase